MKIQELIHFLETLAPPKYQESYDNAGLITGNANTKITGVLICLDSTEAVIAEAIQRGCNLIIAHHPIIFKGLKQINGKNYVERTIIQAIRNDIAIYAIHTNLDNMYHNGVNSAIAAQLGLQNTRLLSQKKELRKLSSFVPALHRLQVEKALIEAGADQVAFTHQTSYSTMQVHGGNGFEAEYMKLEALFTSGNLRSIIKALNESQPDHGVHYDISSVENPSKTIGAGMIGELETPLDEFHFLHLLKDRMKATCVRHTALRGKPIKRVAVCGGAGSFLLRNAISRGADVFVTADFKYHEFFDADSRIIIADIGHYESEQYTISMLHEIISRKFSNFAAYCTKVNTNPVHYLV